MGGAPLPLPLPLFARSKKAAARRVEQMRSSVKYAPVVAGHVPSGSAPTATACPMPLTM